LKFYSDTAELVETAAKSKMKPKRLPPAPHPDDVAEHQPAVMGPCQLQVAVTDTDLILASL
jgi:hypothetical protein